MNSYMTRLPLAIAMGVALAITAGCNNRTADDRTATQPVGAQTAPGTGVGQTGTGMDQTGTGVGHTDGTMAQRDGVYGDAANRPMTDGTRMGDGRDSNQPVNDTWITTKVKSSLLADTNVAGLDINVETVNGVVTLTGNVDQQAQIEHASRIARDIEGVTNVQTTALTVGPRTNR